MRRLFFTIAVGIAFFAVALHAKELSTSKSAEVNAPASNVWALLVDADHWADWNAAVKSSKLIEGNGEAVGSKVKFVPIIGDKKAPMPIKLTVEKSKRTEKLEYTAKVLGMNIVFGFTLEQKDGVCTVESYEKISGAGSGLFAKFFTQEGLDKEHRVWVESIKKKLEARGNN